VVKTGYLPPDISGPLNSFAVKLAVPALLFKAIYNLDFEAAFNVEMLGVFFGAAFVCFLIGIATARSMWDRSPGESVSIGFSAFFSNSVMLGIPIAERGFGAETLTPVFGIVVLHAPILYTVGMFSMEFARRDGAGLGPTIVKSMRSIFTNPLMIAILLGLAANLADVKFPAPVWAPLELLANAAIPVALISIGAALTKYKLKSQLGESLMLSFVSLIIHPLLVMVICHFILGLPQNYVQAAVVVAAMPPGLNGYVFAILYDRAVETVTSSLLLATCLSVITITGWLLILDQLF